MQYLPYGGIFVEQKDAGLSVPYLFNAKEYDEESGFYYFDTRYYNPDIVGFMSVDKASDMFPSHSPYNYAHNNPVRYRDYLGMGPIDGDGVEDHIKVNSKGIVTEVIPMEGPNKFFDDQTGEELVLNDAENNPRDSKLLSQEFSKGDQLYQNLPSQDMWDMIIYAGFEPKKKLENFEMYDRYVITAKLSTTKADFPAQMYDRYNLSSIRVGNGGTEFTGLPFKFEHSNTLYNPSDAGQYIWGAWMRANRFTYTQAWLGSNLNERWSGDSPGDQKAIRAGFNYMSNWMK